MSAIIAVANQKGGCGKTTTTINVAGGMAKAGLRPLVVDADPQASATFWSLAKGQNSLPFDVVPARHLRQSFTGLLDYAESEKYDVVLVDCPPGVTEGEYAVMKFARRAIAGANGVLVPLRPSPADFTAAATFVRYLREVKDAEVKTAVLINARQYNVLGRQARDQAAVLFGSIDGAVVLETTIGHRTPITEVSGSGKTIFEYASPSHEAVREYANLTKEILQWLSNAPLSSLTASQDSQSTFPLPDAPQTPLTRP